MVRTRQRALLCAIPPMIPDSNADRRNCDDRA